MKHVFISYSRKDSQFVGRLVNDLRNAGIETWVDTHQLVGGQNFADEITKAVTQAGAVLYVASSNSVESEWMIREVLFAIRGKIPVISLILGDIGQERLPVPLQSYQWVDFRRGYEPALVPLLAALSAFGLAPQAKPLPKEEPKSKGYVFISYADEDTPFVENLQSFLGERGYNFWDYQKSERDYQALLFIELESIIRDAAATLSVLSPDWKKSKWAAKEYLFSEEVGTPVFLLMAHKMGPTLATVGIPYIDFTSNTQQGFDKLDRELRRKGLI